MASTTGNRKANQYDRIDEMQSPWAGPDGSEVLHEILPAFLDHASLLHARLVCHAWCAAFSKHIKQLQLVQPMSADAASRLGRRAAAEFPGATMLRIMLYHDKRIELSLDLTADEDNAAPGRQLDRPEAAVALLRQFTKSVSLQELQLQLQHAGRFSGVSRMIPLVPQLRVLDLSGCYHESADLLLVARHQPQLQQLLLNCNEFTTLAGISKQSALVGWTRAGSHTPYEPEHIAALAQLQELRVLEVPVPTGGAHGAAGHPWAASWLESIAQLTQLTALHLIQGGGGCAGWPLPTAAITCLSSMTGLRHLRTDTGGDSYASIGNIDLGFEQAQAWGVALKGMQQLTRLELTQAVVCDPLLLVIGSAAPPQLQVLVLQALGLGFDVVTTANGAEAIARIPHLELVFWKNFDCMNHEPLLRLPSLRRLHNTRCRSTVASVLQRWSEEDCNCEACGYHKAVAQAAAH